MEDSVEYSPADTTTCETCGGKRYVVNMASGLSKNCPDCTADTTTERRGDSLCERLGRHVCGPNFCADVPDTDTIDLSKESVGVQACYEYLSRQPYQLWGDYLISQPDRRLEAARWLDQQIRAVNRVRRKGDWNPV